MFFKLLRFVFPMVAASALAACSSSPNYQQGYAPYNQGYGQMGYQQPYAAPAAPAPQPYAAPAAPAQQQYTPQAQGNFYAPVPQGQKIKLKAQDIKFISSYNPPNRAPNIEHMLLVSPEQIIHKWAENRFAVDGTPDRHVRFLIKDAGIVEENIITGSCFKSVKQQYTAKFEATIQIVDAEGRVLIETSATAVKKEITDKDTSMEVREKLWTNLMFDTVKILSSRIDHDLSSPSFNDYIER